MSEAFKQRRIQLLEQLPPASAVIIAAGNIQYRSGSAEYPFRQDSNFYYLTGFCEANARLVLLKDHNAKTCSILFNQAQDPKQAVWTGARLGQAQAPNELMIDEAYPVTQFITRLPKILAKIRVIYYPLASEPLRSELAKVELEKCAVQDILPIIAEMRVIKDELELQNMRYTAKASALAHQQVMQNIKANDNERKVQAEFYHHCLAQGCHDLAYLPIVAAGSNACVLHYTSNNQQLPEDELLLIDAGAEYNCYAADITRTFPINGKFQGLQKDIYEIVLQAQLAGIAAITPGAAWDSIQEQILQQLVAGLIELQVLQGDVARLIKEKAYLPFYMHSSGHFIGLDVHDVGEYTKAGEYRELQPNMVLTVEPGLYFGPYSNAPSHLQGIGVRIEDVVLVTKNGCEVLTSDAPKTTAAIVDTMR